MKPLYEKRKEDWARRAIAVELGINIKNMRKSTQWGHIVANLVNTMAHYHNMRMVLDGR